VPGGRDALVANWRVASDLAAQDGRQMDPAAVRCVADMHIAETRSEAIEQARAGWERHHLYVKNQSSSIKEAQVDKSLDQFIAEKQIVIGTPDDAIAQIRRLEEKLPDFGCLLICEKNFASPENQKRSVELFARYVLPAINGDNRVRQGSFEWAHDNSVEFMGRMMRAAAAVRDDAAE
jgi:limonene 1,2-monooxygenase